MKARSIQPLRDHQLQHAGKQRRVTARAHREKQIAGAGDRRHARILDDDLRALLARLPQVVGGDRRALGDVRPGDPDHRAADHVGPWIGHAIDAECLLVPGAGADHAEPAVVVDERRLEADARELPEQIGLLRRQAGAAEHADRSRAMGGLESCDLGGDARDRVGIRHRGEAAGRGRIAPQRREQPIGMRALQVALDALRAQHASIERELFPRFEANHLVIVNLELNAALLSAEAAVRLDQPLRLDARRQPRAGHRRQVRAESVDDRELVYGDRCHSAPWASPNSARRHFGQTS